MPRTIFGNVSLSVAIVVADASQVAKQLARGNRRFFLGKCRTIFLDGNVEVQFTLLPELQDGGGGDRFGNGPQAKERGRGHGSRILQISHAESRGPHWFTFEHDSCANSRHTVGGHETRNGRFNLQSFFWRQVLLLGCNHGSVDEEQSKQANDLTTEAVCLGESRYGFHGITSSASLSQRSCNGNSLGHAFRVY